MTPKLETKVFHILEMVYKSTLTPEEGWEILKTILELELEYENERGYDMGFDEGAFH